MQRPKKYESQSLEAQATAKHNKEGERRFPTQPVDLCRHNGRGDQRLEERKRDRRRPASARTNTRTPKLTRPIYTYT